MIFKLIKSGWNWLFPFYCEGCQLEGTPVCTTCLDKVEDFPNLICPYCQKKSVKGIEFCFDCSQTITDLDGALIGYIYKKNQLFSTILHRLKYQGITAYADGLAYLFKKMLTQEIIQARVTYIPISKSKIAKRGFNQLELILNKTGMGEGMLVKTRDTKAQMTLDGKNRRNNLKNVFLIKENLNKITTVWIFDDIATTFSTLNEAAKVLKKAGASKVFGIVLAREEVL